jgi:acyl-CoA thioester hydrolase
VSGEFVSESRFRVRYAETDQMGVAYHTHYLVWCEIGRTDFIRTLGRSYASLEAEGVLLVVAEAQIRYAAAARYDDEIRVVTRLEKAQSRAVTFAYEIFREAGEGTQRIATARTRLVATGRDGVPRSLPAQLIERFREVLASIPT